LSLFNFSALAFALQLFTSKPLLADFRTDDA